MNTLGRFFKDTLNRVVCIVQPTAAAAHFNGQDFLWRC